MPINFICNAMRCDRSDAAAVDTIQANLQTVKNIPIASIASILVVGFK